MNGLRARGVGGDLDESCGAAEDAVEGRAPPCAYAAGGGRLGDAARSRKDWPGAGSGKELDEARKDWLDSSGQGAERR